MRLDNNYKASSCTSESDFSGWLKDVKAFKENRLDEIKKQLQDKYKVHVFHRATVEEIITSITQKYPIEGVNVLERMQDPQFRFISADNPDFSINVSHALALAIKTNKTITTQKASKVGAKKRQANADEFAKDMKDKIEELRLEEKFSTFRETVEALNKKGIPSHRGGKWHIRTLQDLYKRWDSLGITQHTGDAFSPPY